jgi:hypothetical protein
MEWIAAIEAGRGGKKQTRSKNEPQESTKGEATMRSSLLRATVIMILLGVILVPGLVQAKSPSRGWAHASRPVAVSAEQGFFSVVWNLLTNLWRSGTGLGSDGSFSVKNGGTMDPNGGTPPPPPGDTTTTTGDNGGTMDPNG